MKMKLHRLRSSLWAVCLLVCTGLALGCEWDQSIDLEQGLDLRSQDARLLRMDEMTEATDAESCQAACCSKADCDLALVGNPMDGRPQCTLVRCWVMGRDVCALQPSNQFEVYRKKTERHGEAKDGGLVPLLGAGEPKTNETNNIRCRLPVKVGSCRAAFPRFYYDVTNQSCQRFVYGGCHGNGNNFVSREECEAACSGVTGSVLPDDSTPAPPQLPVKAARMAPALQTNVSDDAERAVEIELAATQPVQKEISAEEFAEHCEAEPDVGPCRAAFQHWYYNRDTGSCQTFIFGGCKGNKNNYDTQESCMAACTVTVLPSSKKATSDDDGSGEYTDHCMAAPDSGPCRAAFTMFYHDPDTGTCQSFIYGGCKGNNNRYSSMEECQSRCFRLGCIDIRDFTHNRLTPGVFLFVTLAVISALLLGTLIIITLRRRGLSHRPSSVSDKEELLPDPDEQSSVESLTIPDSPKLDKA